MLEVAMASSISDWPTTVEALSLQDLACHAVGSIQEICHHLFWHFDASVDVLNPLGGILSIWRVARAHHAWCRWFWRCSIE
jgi:hypothetical protein